MKIALFCPEIAVKELGSSKVFIELADALKNEGLSVDLIEPERVLKDFKEYSGHVRDELYTHALRNYIQKHGHEYDVLDYDFRYLPFSRNEFPAKTLMVSRSVLYVPHLEHISIPKSTGLRGVVGRIVRGRKRKLFLKKIINNSLETARNSDHITVSNSDDRVDLLNRGINESKISVIPYGIGHDRINLFKDVRTENPEVARLVMVGTFDYRKGARELPKIFFELKKKHPKLKLRMLGSFGMFRRKRDILRRFNESLHNDIEIIPNYRPEELPAFLDDCSIGIFPSYLEGFPFGVLEMHAASIPVVTYKSPGNTSISNPELIVGRGDWQALVECTSFLIDNPEVLRKHRIWASKRAAQFMWDKSAKKTIAVYEKFTKMLR